MKKLLCAAIGVLVSCPALAGPADLQAGLSWRLGFGGAALHASYDLSLGYRSTEHFAPASQVLKVAVSGDDLLATIAGLPFVARSYRADNVDVAPEATTGSSPWYAHSWILWTVGGIAATAALVGSAGGSGDQQGCEQSGGCGVACANNTCAVSANHVDGVGDNGVGCVDGKCTVPCEDTNKPAGCVPFTGAGAAGHAMAIQRDVRPEDLTGGMGDLVAR